MTLEQKDCGFPNIICFWNLAKEQFCSEKREAVEAEVDKRVTLIQTALQTSTPAVSTEALNQVS